MMHIGSSPTHVDTALALAAGDDSCCVGDQVLTPRMSRGPTDGDEGSPVGVGGRGESPHADADKSLFCGTPITPGGPRWSDMTEEETAYESDDGDFDLEPAPKSPSKSARRATRRRRCREAARTASSLAGSARLPAAATPGGGGGRGGGFGLALPAAAFDHGVVARSPPLQATAGISTPTCGSPTKGCHSSPLALPSGAVIPRAGPPGNLQVAPGPSGDPRYSPYQGTACYQGSGVVGDASTRTPTCTSPCPPGFFTTGDASARVMPMAPWVASPLAAGGHGCWSPMAMGTPLASMGSIPMMPGFVATSPMVSQVGGPAGYAATDGFRSFLGTSEAFSADDLAAKLRAAAPETYED